MRIGAQREIADAFQELADAQLWRNSGADWKQVNEKPDQLLGLCRVAVSQVGSDYNVLAARVMPQENLIGREQCHI